MATIRNPTFHRYAPIVDISRVEPNRCRDCGEPRSSIRHAHTLEVGTIVVDPTGSYLTLAAARPGEPSRLGEG